MSSYILLDANLLIGAFDHDSANTKHIESKQIVESLLSDNDVKIAITPLIRYEVLRGVRRVPLEKMVEILNDFEEFEITDVEGNRASEIYRLAKSQELKLDKRSFDLFHYVVAEIRDLRWMSQDNDLSKIESIAKPIIEGQI